MRRLIAVSISLAVFICAFAVPSVSPASVVRHSSNHHTYVCKRLYFVWMDKRAARFITRGTRKPSKHNLETLGRLERCERNPRAAWFVRWYNHRALSENAHRRYLKAHPPVTWFGPATASWFDDSTTACGFVASNGFATTDPNIPCGSAVYFRGPSGITVKGIRDDYGPDPSLHRKWDLRPGLRDALGCGGLCQVYWHF